MHMDTPSPLVQFLVVRQQEAGELLDHLRRLTPPQMERLDRTFRQAVRIMGDRDRTLEYLVSRPRSLSGWRPIDLILKDNDGAKLVIDTLNLFVAAQT